MIETKIKVVFIGGLTEGKIVFDYLIKNKFVELLLAITYPDNTQKPRFVAFPDHNFIVKTNKANAYLSEIKKLNPDLVVVAGWSELLINKLIKIPTLGTIGFHPAKLPKDRGRSVLAWQIEEGYKETALSLFYYTDLPDAGDIIAQERITIADNDYIEDILNKVDFATSNIMHAYFPLIRNGVAPRTKQKADEASFRRLRNEKDSLIDWNRNTNDIYNKIRAISKPYPGAISIIENKKFFVWKALPVSEPIFVNNKLTPGTIICRFYDNSIIMKTKDGAIKLIEIEEIR